MVYVDYGGMFSLNCRGPASTNICANPV